MDCAWQKIAEKQSITYSKAISVAIGNKYKINKMQFLGKEKNYYFHLPITYYFSFCLCFSIVK